MADFPNVRIGDNVRAQEQLLREQFGIEELELVVGGSMGAQQTYEWAVRFPEKVKRAAPIAGTARNTPHDFIYTEALVEAITSDPAFRDGWYENSADVRAGLARHTGGDLSEALGRVRAKTFIMPISEDMFFPVRDCQAEQKANLRQRVARRRERSGPPGPLRLRGNLHATDRSAPWRTARSARLEPAPMEGKSTCRADTGTRP